jgi:signal transduction histidine kinase
MKESGSTSSKALLAATLLVYLLTVAAVSGYSYWNARTAMLKQIDRNLLIGASTVKYILTPGFHDRATMESAISPEEDRDNILALTRFADRAGYKFLYTAVRRDGLVFITASSATEAELESKQEVRYFEPYSEASEALKAAFDADGPVYTTYSDRWGRFRAVILPENSPAGNRYLSVAEFDIGFVQSVLQRKLIGSVLITGVLLAGSLPLFLYFLRREKAYSVALVDANRRLREDLEHRKRMEAERAQFQEQIRRAQKLEAVGTMAGGIAHDFNNMLSIILGYTELAMNQIPPESKPRRQLEEVVTAGNRARDLVRRILTFSRNSEEGFQQVGMRQIVAEGAKMLRSALPSTIDLQVRLHTDDAVLGDPTQVHQVLMNLATNAGHAMQGRAGELVIQLETVMIDSDQPVPAPDLNPGPYVCLTVRDTGHGMDSKTLDRIFDPFFTTKDPGEGTGLGLSVVHGIIKSHGGAVRVISRPGEGAEFKVYFPAMRHATGLGKRPELPLPAGTETILLVDDETALLEMEKKTLESLGYRVEAVIRGSEALDRFGSDPDRYDLVITDMTMPRMTGKELAARLVNIRPDIPVILCTGCAETETGEDPHETEGVRIVLTKPVSKKQMAWKIREILDGSSCR